MYIEDVKPITEVIKNYFEGIFYGDIAKLRNSFVPEAHIYGDISEAEYFKSLKEYLEGVKVRKSPSELNEENRMKILGIEKIGNVAMAKLHVPMLGYNYYDFLSFSLVGGEWKIVNKVFTHVD